MSARCTPHGNAAQRFTPLTLTTESRTNAPDTAAYIRGSEVGFRRLRGELTTMTIDGATATSNRLPMIAAEVRALHDAVNAAARTAVERAREAGTLLLEAKATVPHGTWQSWVGELGISARTAQGYMQLARVPGSKTATVAHLGLRAALREIAARDHPLDEVEAALNEMGLVIDRFEEIDKHWTVVDWFARENSAQLNALLEEFLSLLNRMGAACQRFNDAVQDLGQIPPPEPPNPRLEQYDRVYALSTVIIPRQRLWHDKLAHPAPLT